MMSENWIDALKRCHQSGEAFAMVTILGCKGSTPRDNSSKMLVTAEQTYDTIGGGHLEFSVTNKARELLAANQNDQQIHHFPLGASLGQCCGGSATVLIETFAARSFNVAIFGAGHVAQQLVKILGALPCRISWIDPREDLFPAQLPANVTRIISEEPQYEIAELPARSDILILTHNHALDFELCMAALQHGNLRHIGMIGSQTKANRFVKRLAHRGFSNEQIATIKSPVGLGEVPGKLPMEIAVSIAGELIAIEHGDRQTETQRGLAWKEIKQELGGDIDNREQGYRLKPNAKNPSNTP